MSEAITKDMIDRYQSAFDERPGNRVARNAVSNIKVSDVAVNRDVLFRTDHTFSDLIETGEITNQKASGRCWMFAGLNTFRIQAMKKMNLETFELSQNFTMFWDKFEKANYFLENILATLDEAVDSRLTMWLMSNPLNDGGQWDMFANLVRKYGVVPKSVMPETFNSSNTGAMNALTTLKLREHAAELRASHREGKAAEALRERKVEMLEDIYRMLVINLGEPPREFVWQYRDKDKKFHRDDETMTPKRFWEKYIDFDLDSVVSLINCPTADKPYDKMYTVQYLGNVQEGSIVQYLNVDIDTIKKATVASIQDGQAVWFGCDVGKMHHRERGIMDNDLYEYDLLYGTTFGLDKAARVDYGESTMTHAMVITGVDLREGKPLKWKVENSWGKKTGEKGWFLMSDAWFDEYLFQVLVPRQYLSAAHQAALETDPVALNPWDPMGSLAVMR